MKWIIIKKMSIKYLKTQNWIIFKACYDHFKFIKCIFFYQADGVEVLVEILSDSERPEPELSEATAVLAQITAPWIEDNHNVKGLSENAGSLITAITSKLFRRTIFIYVIILINFNWIMLNLFQIFWRKHTAVKIYFYAQQH